MAFSRNALLYALCNELPPAKIRKYAVVAPNATPPDVTEQSF